MADWISVGEAAELSHYHPYYIRELIRKGKLAAVKKGNAWWVDRDFLTSFLQEAVLSHTNDKRHGPRKTKSI